MSLTGKFVLLRLQAKGSDVPQQNFFFNEGAKVFASDINEETLKTLPAGIEREVLDVTNSQAVKSYAEKFEKIDVLFNVAGWVPHGSIMDSTEDVWNKCMDINVTSMFRTCQAFIPKLLANSGGSIINMASVASSRKGVPLRCAYSTSKGAVIALSKAIAADFIKDNIRCNAIMPGTVDTPSLRGRVAETKGMTTDEALEMFTKRQPTGRFCTAQEVANLALYLASDKSGFTTGGEHIIDGGWSL